jgi:hypothetical protein
LEVESIHPNDPRCFQTLFWGIKAARNWDPDFPLLTVKLLQKIDQEFECTLNTPPVSPSLEFFFIGLFSRGEFQKCRVLF